MRQDLKRLKCKHCISQIYLLNLNPLLFISDSHFDKHNKNYFFQLHEQPSISLYFLLSDHYFR